MAARRARRAAILAKYQGGSSTTSSQVNTPDRGVTPCSTVQPMVQRLTIEDPAISREPSVFQQEGEPVSAATRTASRSASPVAEDLGNNVFDLAKEGPEEESAPAAKAPEDGEQVSAADYDPSLDRREDEARRVGAWRPDGGSKEEPMDVDVVEEEIIEEAEDDEVEDMFAIVTSAPKKKVAVKKTVRSLCL